MRLRYLFGPVSRQFADQNLHDQRQLGTCLAFNADGDLDLAVKPNDSWESVEGKLPKDWRPDYLVLNLPYTTVPVCLWLAPLPRVALANDWNLLWHYYLRCLPGCDLVLTDVSGTSFMERKGLGTVWAANLSGCERLFVEGSRFLNSPLGEASPPSRDIDILFLGNINPAVQKERLPLLARLARLNGPRRVLIDTGVFGEKCLRLLERTKIVFQFSGRRKCGRRSFEAAAAGALIFQEADNQELFHLFAPGRECVAYDADNLESLLNYYLDHEEERQRIAAAAAEKVRCFTFSHLWGEVTARIDQEGAAFRSRIGRRSISDNLENLQRRCWQALSSLRWEDVTLVRDLERALTDSRENPWIQNALGVILARQAQMASETVAVWEVVADRFRAAFKHGFVLAGLNLAQALSAAGQRLLAADCARQTIDCLRRQPVLDRLSLEGLPLCHGFDVLRVEWERAGFLHAGDPAEEARFKRDLILWQLHNLLARWSADVASAYEAAVLRPDLAASRVVLGDALFRSGRAGEAAGHLSRALSANPLDREAAQLLSQALDANADSEGQRRLVEERCCIAAAAPRLVAVESWFAEPRPKGNELVSIILWCTQIEPALRCLEHVLKYTQPPYELIVVHERSTPDADKLLENWRRSATKSLLGWRPDQVQIIAGNTENEPVAAMNQALLRARGQYLVWLNQNAVVTPGWLETLVNWSLHDWPKVGLVAPMTNGAAEPQGVQGAPSNLDSIPAFAEQRRRGFAGRRVNMRRLTGPCLLMRRQVLERIGRLDERFSSGFSSDDDLCLRTQEAGLAVVLAQDVFVYGSGVVFANSSASDWRDKAERGLEILRAKWGPELTAGYSLPTLWDEPLVDGVAKGPEGQTPGEIIVSGAARSNGQLAGRPRVSLCMIVRNEEHNLPDCLRSVNGLFDETIVVDTGSSDRTRDVAREFGGKVHEFPWIDSFGAARNESLAHASGRWIMWLDADDRVDAENRQKLAELLASLGDERDAYAMKVRSVLDAERTGFRLLDQVRLFPNSPEIRWDFRIHEQILPAVNRIGGGVRWAPVIIDHVGYQDADTRRKKLDRNLRLLEMDAADRSDDPFTLFNLGWTLLDLGRVEEALTHLQKSLEKAAASSSILRKVYHLLALCHRQLGRPDMALSLCREGLAKFADDGELLLEEGLMLRDGGDLAGAEQSWSKLFEPRPANYFASEEVGLRGYKTRQLLTEILTRQERWLEAEVQCRAALAERSDFEPAWMTLADIFLRQTRTSDLDALLQTLERQGTPPAKIAWLRARALMQRQQFAQARRHLENAITLDPDAIGPRVLLSHALLQEGRDWEAAERSLRDILQLEPQNREAEHNLELLLRNRSLGQVPMPAVGH